MAWIIGIGIPVALIALFVITRGRKYKAIFAPRHLIELAESLQRAKDAACERLGEPFEQAEDDDRLILSSAGLACMYSVDQDDDSFYHAISISIAGGPTPRGVGESFTVYCIKLLNVPYDKLELGVSDANVHHCRYHLTAEQQAKFRDLRISVPTVESAIQLQLQCSADRKRFEWVRLQLR